MLLFLSSPSIVKYYLRQPGQRRRQPEDVLNRQDETQPVIDPLLELLQVIHGLLFLKIGLPSQMEATLTLEYSMI